VAKRKRADTPDADDPPRFDEAFARLREIVDRLEQGSLDLEASLAEFETGIGLLATCNRILDAADRRIEILTGFDAEGRPRTRPFDATATHDAADASTVATDAAAGAGAAAGAEHVVTETAEPPTTGGAEFEPPASNEPHTRDGGAHPARELFR
jgi:exodeoxyribonuclease VII small subunit